MISIKAKLLSSPCSLHLAAGRDLIKFAIMPDEVPAYAGMIEIESAVVDKS